MIKKTLIPMLLITLTLLLSACVQFNPNPNEDPKNEDYYQGSQGVIMRFSPGSPPPKFYYYSNPDETNSFDVNIELHNEGASDAYGALFISGFSPYMVDVTANGINAIGRTEFNNGGCSFSVGNLLSTLVGQPVNGGVSCGWKNTIFSARHTGGGTTFGLTQDFLNKLGVPITTSIGLRVGNDGKVRLDGGFYSNYENGFERMYHGPLMISLLSAFDLGAFYGVPYNNDGILRGDNYYFPGGDHGFQTFTVNIDNWPQGLDETNMDIAITSCYGYTTYAAPMVCIDPALYEENDKVCTPKEYSWSGSQGAPVAITNVKQDPTPRSTFLTFTVRNVGSGTVIHPMAMQKCSPYSPDRLMPNEKDIVLIGDVRIDGDSVYGTFRSDRPPIRCTPDYEVRLIDGVGTFTCEYEYRYAGSKTAYETPVVVELWYGYKEYMQQSVYLKRVG